VGSKYTKNAFAADPRSQTYFWRFGVFGAWGTSLVSAGRKCRPISVKRNLKIKAKVVVSECTVCYRVVAYYILREYFVHFNIQNTPS